MEQSDWSAKLAHRIAGEVRRYRTLRGLSAQQLSDRCTELGMEIPRAVISNLENGRRTSVTVAEMLVLAAALDVPALSLTFPVGYASHCEALPGRVAPTYGAYMWAYGEPRRPETYGVTLGDRDNIDNAAVNLYHEFYEYAESIRDHMERAMKDEEAASTQRNETLRKRLTDSARLHRMIASDTYADASNMIHEMLERGINPPQLHTYAAIFAELANDYRQLETIPDELLKERE